MRSQSRSGQAAFALCVAALVALVAPQAAAQDTEPVATEGENASGDVATPSNVNEAASKEATSTEAAPEGAASAEAAPEEERKPPTLVVYTIGAGVGVDAEKATALTLELDTHLRGLGYEIEGPQERAARGEPDKTGTTVRKQLALGWKASTKVTAPYMLTAVAQEEGGQTALSTVLLEVASKRSLAGVSVVVTEDGTWKDRIYEAIKGSLPAPKVEEEARAEAPSPEETESGERRASTEGEAEDLWFLKPVPLIVAGSAAGLLLGGAVAGTLAWLDVEGLKATAPGAITERDGLRTSALTKSIIADSLFGVGALVALGGGSAVAVMELDVFGTSGGESGEPAAVQEQALVLPPATGVTLVHSSGEAR